MEDRRLSSDTMSRGECNGAGRLRSPGVKMKTDTSDMTTEILKALLSATDEQKGTALRLLRGEQEQEASKPDKPEPYLTLKGVAKMLNISPCSLWRWGVPGHSLGGRRKFRASEVQAYLESDEFRQRAEELKRQRRETVVERSEKGF
jgi:hypothetical protein